MSEFAPVIDIMARVGAEIAAWRADESAKILHSRKDYKTEADRRAHEMIGAALERLFPGVAILSEEDEQPAATRPSAYWLIDPIDGTASWYEGYDGFVTQAAFIEDARPRFGVVRAPALDRTWSAEAGRGAVLNGAALPTLAVSERLIVIDNYPDPRRAAKTLVEALPATGYLESGSLGLKSVRVADGSADLFAKDVVVRDWDMAPAAAILAEVGGVLLTGEGALYRFDGAMEKPSGCIVARDEALAARAAAILGAAAAA